MSTNSPDRLPAVLAFSGGRHWFASLTFPMRLLVTALITVNLLLVAVTIFGFFVSDPGYDWLIYREAGQRVSDGNLFQWEGDYTWLYSPLMAYVFGLLGPIGYLGWSALHVVALGALRDRLLALLTLLAWPFWADLYNGNTMIFVFVAAVGTLRGSTVATAAYMALCLLMPRPVMLPLLAWIIWQRPAWRLPFAALVVVNAIGVLATGQGLAWLDVLLNLSGAAAIDARDIGPAVLLGSWWLPLGAVIALILTIRGHIGWASIAASPYWLPQYLLMLMLEGVAATPFRQGTAFRAPGQLTPADPDQRGERRQGRSMS